MTADRLDLAPAPSNQGGVMGIDLIMTVRRHLVEGPRVLTTAMLTRLIAAQARSQAPATLNRVIATLVRHDQVARLRDGIFLNRCCLPPAQAAEACGLIRRGAIVSLLTVLGDRGILNNYPADSVWAVVPILPRHPPPAVGAVPSGAVSFRFHGIAGAVLFAPAREDLLAPAPYARATPEAALCHWLYLARQPRSLIRRPPQGDLDLDESDHARLERIAEAMGIGQDLALWRQGYDERERDEEQVTPGLGF